MRAPAQMLRLEDEVAVLKKTRARFRGVWIYIFVGFLSLWGFYLRGVSICVGFLSFMKAGALRRGVGGAAAVGGARRALRAGARGRD